MIVFNVYFARSGAGIGVGVNVGGGVLVMVGGITNVAAGVKVSAGVVVAAGAEGAQDERMNTKIKTVKVSFFRMGRILPRNKNSRRIYGGSRRTVNR